MADPQEAEQKENHSGWNKCCDAACKQEPPPAEPVWPWVLEKRWQKRRRQQGKQSRTAWGIAATVPRVRPGGKGKHNSGSRAPAAATAAAAAAAARPRQRGAAAGKAVPCRAARGAAGAGRQGRSQAGERGPESAARGASRKP